MDYKNLLIRTLVSCLFLILYIWIGIANQYYLFTLISLFYILVLIEIILYFKKVFISISYVFLSFIIFLSYFFLYFDYLIFNLFILTVISFDIFSYLFGSVFGQKKLLPKISPNKTWIGLICGLLLSNSISLVYIYIFHELSFYYVIFINFILLLSFLGDLIESYFKRISKIKNSSNFIPGHGGFFDRIDSFILSVYALLFFNLFV